MCVRSMMESNSIIKSGKLKVEIGLRVATGVMCGMTACLVGFDRQTKLLYGVLTKTATFSDLHSLYVLVWIASGVGVYNLLHLLPHFYFFNICCRNRSRSRSRSRTITHPSSTYPLPLPAWGVYLLDQGRFASGSEACFLGFIEAMAYVVFACNTAAIQGSSLAITGETSFGWMKVCDKFSRFCIQIGGALLCGYVVSILMLIVSSISAYSVFRLYSPKHFLHLKSDSN